MDYAIYMITILIISEKGSLIQQDMDAQWYSHGEVRGVLASLTQLNLSPACIHYTLLLCLHACIAYAAAPLIAMACLADPHGVNFPGCCY